MPPCLYMIFALIQRGKHIKSRISDALVLKAWGAPCFFMFDYHKMCCCCFKKCKGPKSCRSHRVRPHRSTAFLLLQHCCKHEPKSSAAALIWQKIKEDCWNICPALTGGWSVCRLCERCFYPSVSACLFIILKKFGGGTPLVDVQI